MQDVLLDMSKSDMPRCIQGNLIAYMHMFKGLPNMVTVDGDVYWFASKKPAPGNSILRVNWPDENVDARIDVLFEQVGEHIDEIDWMLFPTDKPSDMGQRLEARGMVGSRAGTWLWIDLNTLGSEPSVPHNFRIERVRNDEMMAEWVQVSEAGFGVELGWFYDAYARHGYGDDTFSLHYTGYLGDIPVTTATLLDAGGGASIYDVSTPPAFRQQGFGGMITYALMKEIRNRGYADTWIWSSNMAQSLYRKLGFIDADFGVREHTWYKSK